MVCTSIESLSVESCGHLRRREIGNAFAERISFGKVIPDSVCSLGGFCEIQKSYGNFGFSGTKTERKVRSTSGFRYSIPCIKGKLSVKFDCDRFTGRRSDPEKILDQILGFFGYHCLLASSVSTRYSEKVKV